MPLLTCSPSFAKTRCKLERVDKILRYDLCRFLACRFSHLPMIIDFYVEPMQQHEWRDFGLRINQPTPTVPSFKLNGQ
jgi:hypothetical protein